MKGFRKIRVYQLKYWHKKLTYWQTVVKSQEPFSPEDEAPTKPTITNLI